MEHTDATLAREAAQEALEAMIRQHRAAAIPALIGVCVMWAVENGGVDVVKNLLEHAIALRSALIEARREPLISE